MTDSKMTNEDLKTLFDEVAGPVIADLRKANEELQAQVEAHTKEGFKDEIDKALAEAEADRHRKFAHKSRSELGNDFGKFIRYVALSKGDMDEAKKIADRAGDRRGVEGIERSAEETQLHGKRMAGMDSKALGTDTYAGGGAVVPGDYSEEFIELLRDTTAFRKAGARSLPLNGSLEIPGAASGGTFSYTQENANLAHTAPAMRGINLVEKHAGGTVAISNQLLRSSSPRVDSFVKEDMVDGVKLLEDINFIRGAGGEGKPTGIRDQMATANVFTRTQAASTSTLAEITQDLASLIRRVKSANIPMRSPAFIMTDRELIGLGTVRDTNGNFAFPTLDLMTGGTLFGFPVITTNQLPEDLTVDGTDNSEVYFGDFSQAIIGDGQSIMIDASDTAAYYDGSAVQAAFSKNQTVFRVTLSHDMRIRHTLAFSLAEGIDWGADLA